MKKLVTALLGPQPSGAQLSWSAKAKAKASSTAPPLTDATAKEDESSESDCMVEEFLEVDGKFGGWKTLSDVRRKKRACVRSWRRRTYVC